MADCDVTKPVLALSSACIPDCTTESRYQSPQYKRHALRHVFFRNQSGGLDGGYFAPLNESLGVTYLNAGAENGYSGTRIRICGVLPLH
jgi:hypothetical protein